MMRPSLLAGQHRAIHARGSRCALPAAALLALAAMFGFADIARADEARPDDVFVQHATWKAPTATEVREQLLALVAERQVDPATRAAIEQTWTAADQWQEPAEIFDRLTHSLAIVDPRAKPLVELCARSRDQVVLPSFDWLAEDATPALERNNLRLLYGRWLAQERLVDEALVQLAPLKAEQVADPAALLFYQAVVFHRMLEKKPGLEAIAKLLEREKEIPRRYVSVVKLMQADFEPLKDDSLDHISRRMDDVRRRLDLGRAGPKVREVEDGVIKSLDKLIEEMEAAAAAAAAMAAAGSQGSNRSQAPAPDSVPLRGKGPGNVTRRDIGHESGWGELPPKQRQEALQQIGQDFPAHYRDVIEQYFRKLASQDSDK